MLVRRKCWNLVSDPLTNPIYNTKGLPRQPERQIQTKLLLRYGHPKARTWRINRAYLERAERVTLPHTDFSEAYKALNDCVGKS